MCAGVDACEVIFDGDVDQVSPRSKALAQSLVAAGTATRALTTIQNARRETQKFAAWRGSSVEEALRYGTGVEEALYWEEVRQGAVQDGVGPARVLKASAGIAAMAALHGRMAPGSEHPLCTLARDTAKATLKATPLERGSMQVPE